MKNFFLSLSFFFLLFLVLAPRAYACQCVPPDKKLSPTQQVRAALREANAVFSGVVLNIAESADGQNLEVTIRLTEVWKGSFNSETIVIKTGKISPNVDCGFPFQIDKEYLVYSYFENDWLTTNVCLRTAFLENNADVAILSRIVKKP